MNRASTFDPAATKGSGLLNASRPSGLNKPCFSEGASGPDSGVLKFVAKVGAPEDSDALINQPTAFSVRLQINLVIRGF